MSTTSKHEKRLIKPLFLVPQKWQIDNAQALDRELNAELKKRRKAQQENAVFAVDSNRLVKSCKSPTGNLHSLVDKKTEGERLKRQALNDLNAELRRKHEAGFVGAPEPISCKRKKTPYSVFSSTQQASTALGKDTKTTVRLFRQEWSSRYKFNLVTNGNGSKTAPPTQQGARMTSALTQQASRKLLESGAYMAACRNGFTTFLTLTFNEEARKKLETIICVNGNKTKRYTYTTIKQLKNGKTKTQKHSYKIECINGVPNDILRHDDERALGFADAIAATGCFSPVTFEPLTTIGKEVSRFFDAAQKVYQRGFMPAFEHAELEKETHGQTFKPCTDKVNGALPMFCPEKVAPKNNAGELMPIDSVEKYNELPNYNHRKHHDSAYLEEGYNFGLQEVAAPLDYAWVAEMPENEHGEKNPHVHVLMRWNVEYKYFHAWAQRLEKIWGHGFANLERIKNKNAASNYLLKAVGYLTKGTASEQGDILGNRYGISQSARAPSWDCIGEFYADNFIAILGELREKLSRKKCRITGKINALSATQKDTKTRVAIMKKINNKTPSNKRGEEIERLKKQLFNTNEKITSLTQHKSALPYVTDFCIGDLSEKQTERFLTFAMQERFWNCEVKEHRYTHWQQLRRDTIEAVKQSRAHLRDSEWLLLTKELTWQWAAHDANYDVISHKQGSIYLDENGNFQEVA